MTSRARRTVTVLALLPFALTNACYSYVSTPNAGLTPTDRVRIALTDEGIRELARFLGPGVREAEGVVTEVDSTGEIALAVDFVRLGNEVRMPWTGEGIVRFPPPLQQSVTRQTFQRRQSIVAASVITAVLAGVAIVALRTGGSGGDVGVPPPPPPP